MCLKKEPSGKYHLTFLSEVEIVPILAPNKAIGIDLGINHAIATSDGQFFDSPKPLKANLTKLRKEQRSFSRKKNGSKNCEKQRIKVAKCHEKIAGIRQDWTHQISTFLTRNYRTIVCEELNIQNMLKNRKLARAISDIGWGYLKQKISYKASSAGGKLVEVNPQNTSQLCSACGQLVPKTLNERIHDCQNCGLVLDRDVNAAINILNRGIGRATPKFKPERENVRLTQREQFSLKQEAHRIIA
jgi:putative transposase